MKKTENEIRDSLELERWEMAKKCAVVMEREEWGSEVFEIAAFALWFAMSGSQRESLTQIMFNGPVWDGDHISKSARDDLFKLGLATRVCHKGEDGFTAAKYRASTVYRAAGQDKQKRLDKFKEERNEAAFGQLKERGAEMVAQSWQDMERAPVGEVTNVLLSTASPAPSGSPGDEGDALFRNQPSPVPLRSGSVTSEDAPDALQIPDGFLRSYNGTCEAPSGTEVEYVYEDGERGFGEAHNGWVGFPVRTKSVREPIPVIAYRPVVPPVPEPQAVEIPEGEADENMSAGVGLTKWDGGEMPVPGDTLVRIIFRDGSTNADLVEQRADEWNWRRAFEPDDIIAFRIIDPPSAQPEPTTIRDNLESVIE